MNINVFPFCIAEGISHEPCSDVYAGSGPASEPETKIIMKFGEDLIKLYPNGRVRKQPIMYRQS